MIPGEYQESFLKHEPTTPDKPNPVLKDLILQARKSEIDSGLRQHFLGYLEEARPHLERLLEAGEIDKSFAWRVANVVKHAFEQELLVELCDLNHVIAVLNAREHPGQAMFVEQILERNQKGMFVFAHPGASQQASGLLLGDLTTSKSLAMIKPLLQSLLKIPMKIPILPESPRAGQAVKDEFSAEHLQSIETQLNYVIEDVLQHTRPHLR